MRTDGTRCRSLPASLAANLAVARPMKRARQGRSCRVTDRDRQPPQQRFSINDVHRHSRPRRNNDDDDGHDDSRDSHNDNVDDDKNDKEDEQENKDNVDDYGDRGKGGGERRQRRRKRQ